MLATEVHEKFYLNVTKLRAATGVPPGLRRAYGGLEVDEQWCWLHARGWAVPGRQVWCGEGWANPWIRAGSPGLQGSGLRLCV